MQNKSNLMERIWQGFHITLPLYPWFSDITKQVYGRSIFREMIATDTTWKQLEEMLKDFQNLRNKYYGKNLANLEVYLVRDNRRFTFMFEYGNEFVLWDDNSRKLGEFKIDINTVPTKEFCEWIEQITKDYLEGYIECSDCGKKIKQDEIGGRYFAGIYCKDCWNRKWRAIEAAETYD